MKIPEPVEASKGDSYVSVVEDIMGVKEWFDPETEKLLEEFRNQRDAAYQGEDGAVQKARELATQIGSRSTELDFMMGREAECSGESRLLGVLPKRIVT